jgi:Helix-turn-helix domain
MAKVKTRNLGRKLPITLMGKPSLQSPRNRRIPESDFADELVQTRMQKIKTEDLSGELLTVLEVAHILMKHPNTIRGYIGTGKLQAILIVGEYRIHRSQVLRLLRGSARD